MNKQLKKLKTVIISAVNHHGKVASPDKDILICLIGNDYLKFMLDDD